MASKFTKGSSTFICSCCGHNTRNTGVQSVDSKTCPECWELAGLENMFQDNSEEDFIAQHGASETKSLMLVIKARSTTEYAKACKSFDMLAAYFPGEDEVLEVRETKEITAASDHSVKGAVAICKAILAANPQIDRKAFIAEAGKQGVIRATAGAQYNRIKKGA